MAERLVRLPAFVDLHVHFREPGFTEKEDVGSGARAAAAGGFTTVCMMPNTRPAIDCEAVLMEVDRRGREAGHGIRVFSAAAMTVGQEGRLLCDFDALAGADTVCRALTGNGVCGISEDGMTLADEALMEHVCSDAARLGLPIMDHAEPELEIIRRDIALAKRTGARFHIQHVSLAGSVALLREAKAEGVPVTCETAPHYFALTESAIFSQSPPELLICGQDPARERRSLDTAVPRVTGAKMNPPLRTERDRLAIIEGLADGTIDCIATDHAPHEAAAKALPFEKAANGIVGLETAFAVAYTVLVKGGFMPLAALTRLMSENPARIIGLPIPQSDYVLLELETQYEIDAAAFRSKSKNTPFQGMRVYGRIEKTICGGKELYSRR